MHQIIEKLLVLQDRDKKLMMLEREKKSLPVEKAAVENRQKSAKDAFDKVREQFRQLELEKKKLELDAQAKRDSIAKFKTQQAQTRRNEEYQALISEIKRHEDMIQAIEDKELEIMDQAEQFKAKVAAAQADLDAAERLAKDALASIEARAKAIADQEASLKAEKEKIVVDIPSDVLFRYGRILANKGDQAVVGVEHEVCMGCHMKITTQTVVKVKAAKEIVHCEQCGRILYWDEPA